jgi:MFS family permease
MGTSDVLDFLGRTYRIGPAAEELTGRSRGWMLWLPWAAMGAVGVLQYGFGSLVPDLLARGWSLTQVMWLLALWTVFQASAGFPAAFLRERGRIGPRATMIAGAALVAVGPLALAHGSHVVAVVGYSVLSGTGAGLVYATCTSTVAKWFPDRSAAKVSLATGAFAYGSVPFAVAFVFAPVTVALDVTAVLVGVLVAAAGLLFRDPPPNWWPPHIDPREWARRDPKAVRQFTAGEAVRTGVLPLMYLILFGASAVSLFDVTFLALIGNELDAGLTVIAIATGLLLSTNGGGRALAIRISDRIGRHRTLGRVLAILGIGQICFAGAATSGSIDLLVFSALLAGIGSGAFYPLFASLAREYFGERSALETHAVVYSAKAFGGVVGVGLASLVTPTWGFATLFLIAGGLALTSAALCPRLRQPGRTPILPKTALTG